MNSTAQASTLRIAAAQLNPIVGDIDGNIALIETAYKSAAGADLLITTELAVSGYPPEDLVLHPGFINRIEAGIAKLATATAHNHTAMLVGTPWRSGDGLYNAVLLLEDGKIAAVSLKHHLPNYGVFDEKRVFAAGPLPSPLVFRGFRLGVMVCEDMWFEDVASHLAKAGAEILIVPNGSPYEIGKAAQRIEHARSRVEATGLPLLYINQVGGQDELVFDGASFVVTGDGDYWFIGAAFQSSLAHTEWVKDNDKLLAVPTATFDPPSQMEEIYTALMLGLRDYVDKNGFPGIVLGLSGGIDSALSAAIAADALGPKRVRAVMMPSPYTSRDSLEDAAACAMLLGISLENISIGPGMAALGEMLGDLPGISGENIQSRLRGMALMAISNRDGPMVLSTGNKSEMAVGYATLYGDMCGGFAVLKDVYKTQVFALSQWRNGKHPASSKGNPGPVMPERVITKPPTAELRPNQTDQDSLPPYTDLDAILQGLIEGQGEIEGYSQAEIVRVWRMLDRAEYKRRQSPPGVKITARSFGKERRMPIVNRYGPHDHV
jgi:NAD+ synthase